MTANILMDCSLEISVWDYEKNSGSHFLGGIRMNLGKFVNSIPLHQSETFLGSGYYHGSPCDWMDATEKELLTWKRMLKKPGVPVKDVLPLRERYRNRTVVLVRCTLFII